MSTEITGTEDILDSRDIITRLEELESEREALTDQIESIETDLIGDEGNATLQTELERTKAELIAWDADYGDEFTELRRFVEEESGYCSDWGYGETLIRDNYFTEYAMELLQDIGDLPRNLPSYLVIDEEATAENIQQDYTLVTLFDSDYWTR